MPFRTSRWGVTAGLLLAACALPGMARAQQLAQADVQQMSIEQLANVEITSVSKAPQSLSTAAAAVYVITHDDIIRSGATSLPEMLRLAPNLQVAQQNANAYAITARGFNGNAADKLLVLIDGRSIYTSLYGGVLWDEKDVLPENVERIEVISGPGGTLWGANAVNGVINIITRKAADTAGGILTLGAGNREARASLQYGGALTDDLHYRLYGEWFTIPHSNTSAGTNALDGWNKGQGGFRLDYTPAGPDSMTLQGDYYQGSEDASATTETNIWGGTIQGNWKHELGEDSSLQLLGYYDGTRRYADGQGYGFDTYDLEAQHSFSPFDGHEVVWGVGGRIYEDQFNFTGAVQFLPPSRTESMGSIFAQDSWTLTPSLTLVLGAKLEADPFTNIQLLPNARLSWKAANGVLFWLSYAYSVRAPTRFDVDLSDVLAPGIVTLVGDRDFQPETVRAYEAGTRVQLSDALSFSLSSFYNQYNDLRSVEVVNATPPMLWSWGNLMEANSYGLEAWANYSIADWWRLSAGLNLLHEHRKFKPGSSQLGGVAAAGDDPDHQAWLRSSMTLSPDVNFDADFRMIGALPDPKIPAYEELNLRLGWTINDRTDVSLSAFNLLHPQHLEYELAGATIGTEIYRSFFIQTRWHF